MSGLPTKPATANIESGVVLTQKEKTAIKNFLIHSFGPRVGINFRVNQDLVGGLKIQIGDWIIDSSLKSQLEQLSHILS
jgi:ATP synthase F1 delta subunit